MKRIWGFVAAGFAAAIIIYAYWVWTQPQDISYSYYTVQRDTVVEEVVVSGKVQPAQLLTLAFEQSGAVESVEVEVGDSVSAGQVLALQDTTELQTQFSEARAVLNAEQARLFELEQGTRGEEIAIAETKYANTQRSLEDAKNNLNNTKQKAVTDLNTVALVALTSSQEAVLIGKNSLITIAEIQEDHFQTFAPQENELAKAQAAAIFALFDTSTGGRLKEQAITDLTGGLYGEALKAFLQPSVEQATLLVVDVISALQSVGIALDTLPIANSLSATQKSNLAAAKTSISNQLVKLSDAQQDIVVQRVANTNAIAAAERQVTDAQNAVNSAFDELLLKRAGATPEQIATQQALVRAAEAKVATVERQISRRSILSPIAGVVTRVDIEDGEVATAQNSVIDVISDNVYEIEARVPEVDVIKVDVEQEALVMLDAYGTAKEFKAIVTEIDPAETVIDGVSAYIMTLQFIEPDVSIRSGMTAEIFLQTRTREDVLIVPRRLVTQLDGRNAVEVVISSVGEQLITEQKIVTLGLLGSSGFVEIVSGLSEGDKVLSQ